MVAVISDTSGVAATLMAHLAVQVARAGEGPKSGALIAARTDEDLARWSESRPGTTPMFKVAHISSVESIRDWAREAGVRTCFIEAPLAHIIEAEFILKAVDLVVFPMSATSLPFAGLLASKLGSGQRMAIVLIRKAGDIPDPGDMADIVRETEVKIAGIIRRSRDYDEPFLEGSSAMESRPQSRAARDIVELWANLRKLLRQD